MAERQKHGFIFEDSIVNKEKLIKSKNYTDAFDAYNNNGTPYQIKTIKYGSSIDLGDIFRNANKDKDFYLIIGFWEGAKDNIIEIYKLFIPYKKWKELLKFDYYDELRSWISSISNDYSYDAQWKKEMNYWKKLFGERKIAIRFKRDHKNQKRIQCAINNTVFYNYFLKEFECQNMV